MKLIARTWISLTNITQYVAPSIYTVLLEEEHKACFCLIISLQVNELELVKMSCPMLFSVTFQS